MLKLLRRLSLRHLLRSPFRSGVVIVGIALGIALHVSTRATSDSLVVTFERMVERVSGKADATVRGTGAGLSGKLLPKIRNLDAVKHAASMVEVTLHDPKADRPLMILGLDFLGDTHFLPFDVEKGAKQVVDDPLAFVNNPTAILISETLAERRGLGVGDSLRLVSARGPEDFEIRGILADSGPAAAFDGQVAVMHIDAAQVSFALGRKVDRIEVAFAEGADRKAALERLRSVVGNRGTVELPEERRRRVVDLLDPIRTVLSFSGVLALVVAMFLIYNAVAIAVAQRRFEVGVLRALGATRTSVTALFCFEALALAVPGAALGLLGGQAFAEVAIEQTVPTISKLYLPLRPPPPDIGWPLMVEAVAIGAGATLLSALLPALRAARIDPALTVRGRTEETTPKWPVRGMALAGVAVAAAAVAIPLLHSVALSMGAGVVLMLAVLLVAPLVLVGLRRVLVRPRIPLGVAAKLGIANVERDLGRSMISTIALAVAVTVSIAIGAWRISMEEAVTGWFEESLSGDLVVSAGSPTNDQYNVPFAPETLSKVRKTDGVQYALPYRFITQTYQGAEHMVSAFDTKVHARLQGMKDKSWKIIDGAAPLEPDELADGRRVLLSEGASRHLGVGANDTVQLKTPDGPADFDVRAVIGDYFLDRPAILMDRAHFTSVFGDERIDSIDVFVTDGAHIDAVAERIRDRLGGDEGIFVTRAGELQAEIARTVEEGFRYARSVELIALLVALMGILGTMLALVLDRSREIGVLRAIGASLPQVALIVASEAIVLGVAAAILGSVFGALQGWVLVEGIVGPGAEWKLPYTFPLEATARIAALVVVTAAVAGLPPAWRACRIPVRDALNRG